MDLPEMQDIIYWIIYPMLDPIDLIKFRMINHNLRKSVNIYISNINTTQLVEVLKNGVLTASVMNGCIPHGIQMINDNNFLNFFMGVLHGPFRIQNKYIVSGSFYYGKPDGKFKVSKQDSVNIALFSDGHVVSLWDLYKKFNPPKHDYVAILKKVGITKYTYYQNNIRVAVANRTSRGNLHGKCKKFKHDNKIVKNFYNGFLHEIIKTKEKINMNALNSITHKEVMDLCIGGNSRYMARGNLKMITDKEFNPTMFRIVL
jgi:hypothetical protein